MRFRWFLIGLLGGLILVSAAVEPGWAQDSTTLYSRASEAYWNEDYRRAENLYRQIVKKGRENTLYWDARFGLAQSLYQQEKLIEARRHFSVVRDKHPDRGVRGDALFSQAEIAILLDNLAEARELLNTFLDVYQDHVLYSNAKKQLKLLEQARPRPSERPSESTSSTRAQPPSRGSASSRTRESPASMPLDTESPGSDGRTLAGAGSTAQSSDSPAESGSPSSQQIEPNLEPQSGGSPASDRTGSGSATDDESKPPRIKPDLGGSTTSPSEPESSESPDIREGRITIPDDPGTSTGSSGPDASEAARAADQPAVSGGAPLAGIGGTAPSTGTEPSPEDTSAESTGKKLIKPNLAKAPSPESASFESGASAPDEVGGSSPIPEKSPSGRTSAAPSDTGPEWNKLARRLERLQEQQQQLLRTNQKLRDMLNDLGKSPGGDTVPPASPDPSTPSAMTAGPSDGSTASPSRSPQPGPTMSSPGLTGDASVSELMEAGRYDRAWQKQQQQLQEDPSADQYHQAYRILRARGADPSTAYSYLRKAINNRSPTPVEYLLDELDVLRKLDRDDRLRRRLPRIKEAVQERGSATQEARYHYERGRLYRARGNPDQAFFEFMDSIEAKEDSKWARESRQIVRNEL